MNISVMIPTFRRFDVLKRAVANVIAQTYHDWELIVSDDEVAEDSETWKWLLKVAQEDSRIHPIKNYGPNHGQVYNVNNGLRATQGKWVKVLFDDDGMLPNCLERFAEVAQKFPDAAIIGCRGQIWRHGAYIGDEPNYQCAPIEVIRRDDAVLSLCLFDRWNGTTPTHILVRGDLVRSGCGMVEDNKFRHVVDVRWFSRLFARGDHVVISDVLVEQRQGEMGSQTAEAWANPSFLDDEDFRVYEEIFIETLRDKRWPTIRQMRAMIACVKTIFHLRNKRIGLAFRMAAIGCLSLKGMRLSARFFLQKAFPARFAATSRLRVYL